jgi:class 3 adenylate cyclase
VRELPEGRYAGALAEHRRIVREAAAENGGTGVETQGDAFFIVFPTAGRAATAGRAVRGRLATAIALGAG